MSEPYREDLAEIHDRSAGALARAAAGVLVAALRSRSVERGTVLDLGCGSGILAERLLAAGYHVVGYDLSAAMLRIAGGRAPAAELRHESFLTAELPPCVAAAAIGECVNYLFDRRQSRRRLAPFFRRIGRALAPGGPFLLDVAAPGRVPGGTVRTFTAGDGWAVLMEAREHAARARLERRIDTFVRQPKSDLYRRDREVHVLRLFERAQVLSELRQAGLRARSLRRYGELTLPPGLVGYLARRRD